MGGITGRGFLPGQSGNPNGRPKGKSLTRLIRKALKARTLDGKPIEGNRNVAQLLADVFVAEALDGKFPFAKEVIDRIDGKVADKHEHTATVKVDVRLMSDEQLRAIVEAEGGGGT